MDQEEAWKVTQQTNLAIYKMGLEESNAHLAAVVAFAQGAIKSSMLINGGAAVAILAFIGNIWKGHIEASIKIPQSLGSSLVYFSAGVLAAAIAYAFTYTTQYFYHQALIATLRKRVQNDKKGIASDNVLDAGKTKNRIGYLFHGLAVILITLSFIFFGLGISHAYATINVGIH